MSLAIKFYFVLFLKSFMYCIIMNVTFGHVAQIGNFDYLFCVFFVKCSWFLFTCSCCFARQLKLHVWCVKLHLLLNLSFRPAFSSESSSAASIALSSFSNPSSLHPRSSGTPSQKHGPRTPQSPSSYLHIDPVVSSPPPPSPPSPPRCES